MQAELLDSARALPTTEKIELIHVLWDDLVQTGYEPAVTPSEAAELDRRLENYRKNPGSAVSLDAVKVRLNAKYGA